MSAIGNVIAFNTTFRPEGVVGAFNDRARDVWAWAVAEVPDTFHPRHALERWYRYHLFPTCLFLPCAGPPAFFVGTHDFSAFTPDPAKAPLTVDGIEVSRAGRAILVDIRAQSFRRAMVRRIVVAAVGHATGEIAEDEIRDALRGARPDFGTVPPEPLF